MALIVEDGTGVENANSYVDLAYANAYLNSILNELWMSYTDVEKEAAILRGMMYLEGLNWKGDKADYYYCLEWPREGVIDRNHYLIPSDEIPEKVKKALCELAVREAENPGCTQPDYGSKEKYITEKTVDVITVKWDIWGSPGGGSGGGNSDLDPIFTRILALLRGLLRGTTTFEILRS